MWTTFVGAVILATSVTVSSGQGESRELENPKFINKRFTIGY